MVNDNVLFQVWNQLISFSSVNGWLAFAKVDQLICHFRKTIEGTSAATVKILLKTTKKKEKVAKITFRAGNGQQWRRQISWFRWKTWPSKYAYFQLVNEILSR